MLPEIISWGPYKRDEVVSQDRKFEKGEMCEGQPWEIVHNYETTESSALCKHCTEQVEVEFVTSTGHKYKKKRGTVPRAVVAYNEGNNNSTAVCLDCILENA